MTRHIAGLIIIMTVLGLIYAAGVRPERNPLLIDAAFSGDWCDVNNPPPPPPRVRSPIEPRQQMDQRTFS